MTDQEQQQSDLIDLLCHCHTRRSSTASRRSPGYESSSSLHSPIVPRLRQVSDSNLENVTVERIKIELGCSPDERAIMNETLSEDGWSLSEEEETGDENDSDEDKKSDSSHYSKWKNYKPPADLREMEEQFKKALMSNAQLDNEKQVYVYQIDAMKDDLAEMEEEHVKVVKEMKEKTRALDMLKRDFNDLQEEYRCMQEVLCQRDKLIQDHGLIVVNFDDASEDGADDGGDRQRHPLSRVNGNIDGAEENGECNGTSESESGAKSRDSRSRSGSIQPSSSASVASRASSKDVTNNKKDVSQLFNGPCLISREIINLLDSFEGTTLESKMKCMAEEREDLILEVQRLKLELEDERARNETLSVMSDRPLTGFTHHTVNSSNPSLTRSDANFNGIGTPGMDGASTCGSVDGDAVYDSKKQLHDYKFKLKKAEQEIALLQGNNTRLEGQLARTKGALDDAEKLEDELKSEKRRILRELRETQTKVEELETANSHLQKRIDKLKETRMAIIHSAPNTTP